MQPLSKSLRDGRPLAERVYEAVRDSIVDGELDADQQLVQKDLAEMLGVSRTPVRDALNRLTHEGLVTYVPGTGHIVNGLTAQDVIDIYQVRYTLETLAVRMAAGRHSSAELARLRSLIEEMAAEADGTASRYFDLNREFHVALIAPCGNRMLMQLVNTLWDHPVNRRITRSYVREPTNVDKMIAEHRELLDVAATGDADQLAQLISGHMEVGYGDAVPDGPAAHLPVEYAPDPTSASLDTRHET
jgi:DNA-binding GntR family transcriptional regulator